MKICNGCGGIVGRDCFNPIECEWISQQIEHQAQDEVEVLKQENAQLRNRIYELESILETNTQTQ